MTDFGDAAVTLPLLLTVGVVLALRDGSRRLGWIAAIGGAFAAILVLKLAFGVFPDFGQPLAVRSPSGHTATATAAYGGLALLLSGRRSVGVGTALAVAAAIGFSRVALDAHTVSEVLIGASVGIGAVLLLSAVVRRAPALSRPDAMLLLALAGAVVLVGYGHHADIEPRLVHIEQRLSF